MTLSTFCKKVWRLPWPDRLLLLEAVLWLAVAGIVIAVLPFRNVGHLASRPVRGVELPQKAQLTEITRIRWAIMAGARWVPWRAMCFQQGLAAQLMLRLRGIPSVLCYGAARDDGSLLAHVWLRASGIDVVGCEIADRFALLATFPPECGPRK